MVGLSDPQVFLSQAGFVCAEMLYVAKNCVQPLQAFTGYAGQRMTVEFGHPWEGCLEMCGGFVEGMNGSSPPETEFCIVKVPECRIPYSNLASSLSQLSNTVPLSHVIAGSRECIRSTYRLWTFRG